MSLSGNLWAVKDSIPSHVTLVAVSKTKPISLIQETYDTGHRDFGENRVQELVEKWETLPKDIRWHQIGHLQSNKVKYIASFVYLIHAVDSEKLIREIDKRAKENDRIISILLQFHIASEESKFGFSEKDVIELMDKGIFAELKNLTVKGVMGMATFTDNTSQIRKEFQDLKNIYLSLEPSFNSGFDTISMGMSGDYSIAIEEGSTMVRVGSKIFGERSY